MTVFGDKGDLRDQATTGWSWPTPTIASLAGRRICVTGDGGCRVAPRIRRMLSPVSSMRWAASSR